MYLSNTPQSEDPTFDALLLAAFLPGPVDESDEDATPNVPLLPEDKDALDALGDDLIKRIMAGDVERRPTIPASDIQTGASYRHASGFNRNGSEAGLSEAARREMQEKLDSLPKDDEPEPPRGTSD